MLDELAEARAEAARSEASLHAAAEHKEREAVQAAREAAMVCACRPMCSASPADRPFV